jgi:hypothetical protein
VRSDRPFVPRPDLRGARAAEWDEQVADLHYADTPEYATGHGISAEWEIVDSSCLLLRTAWIPSAEVEKTATVPVPGVEISMEALRALWWRHGQGPLRPRDCARWIEARRGIATLPGSPRAATELLLQASRPTGSTQHRYCPGRTPDAFRVQAGRRAGAPQTARHHKASGALSSLPSCS